MKNNINSGKYIIYCRKSSESEDKQVASIEDQLVEMQKIADQYGLQVIDIITESKSAKKPGREEFNKMISRIEQGEADGIICWKLNRLARNPIDGGRISWLIQQGIIQHIKTYTGGYYPTDNVIVMAVELGVANQFVKDLSEDVKRGLRNKANRGWYPINTLVPGYIHNPKEVFEPGDLEVINDSERFHIMRKGWDLLLSGTYSIKSIYKILTDELGLRNKNGKKYAEATVYRLFTDKFYCGYFSWKDESGTVREIKGKHIPMITEEEFEKAQQMFGKNGRPRQNQTDLNFPFRGPIKCGECGCKVTAERKKQCICSECKFKFSMVTRTDCPKCKKDISEMTNPRFVDITYYHCTGKRTCSQKSNITGVLLDQQIAEYLSKISIPPEFHSWLMDGFRSLHKEEINNQKDSVALQNTKETALMNKLDRYTRMRADEEISGDEYRKYKTELEEEIAIIQRNRSINHERILNWFDIAENYVNFSENALEKFQNGTLEQKKVILSALSSNLTLKDKILSICLPKALIELKECCNFSTGEKERFEPTFNLVEQRENTTFMMLSLIGLRG